MREKIIERRLTQEVARMGGLALKFVSPGMAGVPDRLLLFPGGKIVFVEMKAPGKQPTPLQRLRHKQLRDLGFKVYVIDSATQIQSVLEAEFCLSARRGSEAQTTVRSELMESPLRKEQHEISTP